MIDYIYILDIVEDTTVDGPGLRTSVYSAGCPHRCPGCHNPQSWDICNGKKMSLNEILSVIKSNDFDNVTFSGGDPFFQPEAFTELKKKPLKIYGAIPDIYMRRSLLLPVYPSYCHI